MRLGRAVIGMAIDFRSRGRRVTVSFGRVFGAIGIIIVF
jgi:hypothetical protein